MRTAAHRANVRKLVILAVLVFLAAVAYLLVEVNPIVTPCLLGMTSLYTLIHTAVVFVAGSGSILASNANVSFTVDLVIMGVSATVI